MGARGPALLRTVVTASGVQLVAGFGFAAWLLFARARLGDEGGGALLLAYWALNIPLLGQEIAQIARQYPTQRNLALRLLEPLGAPEEDRARSGADRAAAAPRDGVRIELREVTIRAGGHTILEDASVVIEPGAHVAIVGPSGAGKSTLVGLLLGWHRPARRCAAHRRNAARRRASRALRSRRRGSIRRSSSGTARSSRTSRSAARERSGLGHAHRSGRSSRRASSSFPTACRRRSAREGRWCPAARGSACASVAALGRPGARLVILDEPFRGLEREQRATLLRARARALAARDAPVRHPRRRRDRAASTGCSSSRTAAWSRSAHRRI